MWVTVWKDDRASEVVPRRCVHISSTRLCLLPVCRPINDSTEPVEAQGPFEVINPDTISERQQSTACRGMQGRAQLDMCGCVCYKAPFA